jgi:hypothetical protein
MRRARSVSNDLLDLTAHHLEFETIDHRRPELLLTVEPKSKLLVHTAKFWTPTAAIEPKIASAFGSRKLHCVRQESVCQFVALRARMDGKSVNKGRRPCSDFGPVDHILEFKAKDADWAVIVTG